MYFIFNYSNETLFKCLINNIHKFKIFIDLVKLAYTYTIIRNRIINNAID